MNFYRRITTVRVSVVMGSLRRERSVTVDWRNTHAGTPVATLASWPRNTSTQTRGMSNLSNVYHCRYFVNLCFLQRPAVSHSPWQPVCGALARAPGVWPPAPLGDHRQWRHHGDPPPLLGLPQDPGSLHPPGGLHLRQSYR